MKQESFQILYNYLRQLRSGEKELISGGMSF